MGSNLSLLAGSMTLLLGATGAPVQDPPRERADGAVQREVALRSREAILSLLELCEIQDDLKSAQTEEARRAAQEALLYMHPLWKDAAEDLRGLLSEGSERRRGWVAHLLARTRGGRKVVREGLVSEDQDVRHAAVFAARSFGHGHEVGLSWKVAEALEDDDPEVRYSATYALGRLLPHSLADLLPLLEDQEADVRRAAVEGIERALWPHLTSPVRDEYWGSFDRSIQLRATFDLLAETSVPALAAALSDPDVEVRALAAIALYKLGDRAVAAYRALTRAAAGEDPAVALLAAAALAEIDRCEWDDLKALGDRLAQTDMISAEMLERPTAELIRDLGAGPRARWRAASALLVTALDSLIEQTASKDQNEALAARETLEALRTESLLYLRELVAEAEDVGTFESEQVDELLDLWPASLPVVRHEFLRYSRHVAPWDFDAVTRLLARTGRAGLPIVLEGLEHWNSVGRWTARDVLLETRPDPRIVMPFVLSAWRSGGEMDSLPGEDPYLPDASALAVGLGPGAIPYLVRGLGDRHELVRWRCARALAACAVRAVTRR